jgi:hypothetical protein
VYLAASYPVALQLLNRQQTPVVFVAPPPEQTPLLDAVVDAVV